MSGREPLPSPSATELRPSMPGPVPADDGGVTVSDGAKSVRVEAPKASSPGGHDFLRRRRLVVGTLGVLALAAALWFGIPWVQLTLSTVSTDDAFVNGHVTLVAARVGGQYPGSWSMTTTVCTREISSPNWTRSPSRTQSPKNVRPSISQRRIYVPPRPP